MVDFYIEMRGLVRSIASRDARGHRQPHTTPDVLAAGDGQPSVKGGFLPRIDAPLCCGYIVARLLDPRRQLRRRRFRRAHLPLECDGGIRYPMGGQPW